MEFCNTTATGKRVTHAYSKAGRYNVTLTVTDDRGAKDTTSKTVEVYPVHTTITVGSSAGTPNATIHIPIAIENVSRMAGIQFELNYNSSVATGMKVEKGELTADFTLIRDINNTAGRIKIAMAGAHGVNGSGSVAIIAFKLAGNIGDSTALTLKDLKLNNEEGEAIKAKVVDGFIGS